MQHRLLQSPLVIKLHRRRFQFRPLDLKWDLIYAL